MMTVEEVLDAYVRDVASYLPAAKRADIAVELRALLHEELAATAESTGQAPDEAMTMAMLTRFGRPAAAAARYEPRAPLLDPADNHSILLWAGVGALVVAVAADQPLTVPAWVGLVFVWFAAVAWWRRRRPAGILRWRARRSPAPAVANRAWVALPGIATLVFPFAMYLAPQTWWNVTSLGVGYPGGLGLTETFLSSWLRKATLVTLGAVVVVYAAATVTGGWRPWSRAALNGSYLLLGALMLVHAAPLVTAFGREPYAMLQSPHGDETARPFFAVVGGLTLLVALYDLYRESTRVRLPLPDQALQQQTTA